MGNGYNQGMINEDFNKEVEAYKAASQLMAEAERVASLFRELELPTPRPVARMIGDTNGAVIEEPHKPRSSNTNAERPANVRDDWISIPIDQLSMTATVLVVLREAPKPLKFRQIVARVKKLRGKAPEGSVFNVGSRLEGDLINKKKGDWSLIDQDRAPVFEGKRAWGPKEVFSVHDLAAHRRDMIVRILRDKPSGLTLMQLVDALSEDEECVAPVGKDILHADTQAMAKDYVIKRQNKMWKIF